MHLTRWVLTCGWLLLIASLFYDPISLHITAPEQLWSPFRIKKVRPTNSWLGKNYLYLQFSLHAQLSIGALILCQRLLSEQM